VVWARLIVRTAHKAEEAYVTGTFDNWSKTNKLIKGEDGSLEKDIELPLHEKVSYKVTPRRVLGRSDLPLHELPMSL
jgi:hypothetical protein